MKYYKLLSFAFIVSGCVASQDDIAGPAEQGTEMLVDAPDGDSPTPLGGWTNPNFQLRVCFLGDQNFTIMDRNDVFPKYPSEEKLTWDYNQDVTTSGTLEDGDCLGQSPLIGSWAIDAQGNLLLRSRTRCDAPEGPPIAFARDASVQCYRASLPMIQK